VVDHRDAKPDRGRGAARNPSETIGSSTLWYTGAIRDPAGISSRWNVHSDR